MQMQEKKLLILKHIKSEKRLLSMSRNLIEIHDQKINYLWSGVIYNCHSFATHAIRINPQTFL